MSALSLPPRRDSLRQVQEKVDDLVAFIDELIRAEAEAEEQRDGYQSGVRRLRAVRDRVRSEAPRSAP